MTLEPFSIYLVIGRLQIKTVANLIVATVFIYWVIGFLSDCWLTSQPIDCVLFIIMVK